MSEMISYIGDLSKQDAIVLKMFAEKSNSILEFGVGASTQILRHYSNGIFDSVDSSQDWINKTINNIKNLGITKKVDFHSYDWTADKKYDFSFIDGSGKLRLQFAVENWKNIIVGGYMAFHDTRTDWAIQYIYEMIKIFYHEIDNIEFNKDNSNITVIKKREPLFYENWNIVENRQDWQIGIK